MITTMCLIWWIPDTGAFGPFVTAHVTPPTTRPTTATAATSDRRRCAENHRNIRRTDRESPRADDIDAPSCWTCRWHTVSLRCQGSVREEHRFSYILATDDPTHEIPKRDSHTSALLELFEGPNATQLGIVELSSIEPFRTDGLLE